jgi:hypothetical protein
MPAPAALRAARALFWIQSAGWMVLGALLVVGGLIVLAGGNGIPGVVNDPAGDPPLGGWVVGTGLLVAVIASWGLWIAWSMRRETRGARISALIYCAIWMILGVIWICIATSPIPGFVVIAVNAAILVGLLAPSSWRAGVSS